MGNAHGILSVLQDMDEGSQSEDNDEEGWEEGEDDEDDEEEDEEQPYVQPKRRKTVGPGAAQTLQVPQDSLQGPPM